MNKLALLGGVGSPELLLLVFIPLHVLVVWSAWRILTKAGLPGWYALGAIIPLLNLFLLLYVAFVEWPIERRLRESGRLSAPPSTSSAT